MSFTGDKYRLANNWYPLVKLEEYANKPINYLEIGTARLFVLITINPMNY